MYDNIRLWINRHEVNEEGFNNLPQHLTDCKQFTDISTGEISIVGFLGNLRIFKNETGMSIKGSLSRFYYGESGVGNLYSLDRRTTEKAVEKLSCALGIDCTCARVTALEFGRFFVMQQPISSYLRRLGDYPRLMRCSFEESTLYYRHRGKQRPKTIAIYDKVADAKAKNYSIPQGFDSCNLLKVELRLCGSLSKQLKCGEVMASSLYDREFYKRMVETYQQEFAKISLIPQPTNGKLTDNIKSVGDGVEVLLSRLLNSASLDIVESYVNELKANNTFANRSDYYRLKRKLQQIQSKAAAEDFLIQELKDCILNLGICI